MFFYIYILGFMDLGVKLFEFQYFQGFFRKVIFLGGNEDIFLIFVGSWHLFWTMFGRLFIYMF